MIPVNMKEQPGTTKHILAENQTEDYTPLPCLAHRDGRVVSEWILTDEERQFLLNGGRLRLSIWCGKHYPPTMMEIVSQADALPLEPVQ